MRTKVLCYLVLLAISVFGQTAQTRFDEGSALEQKGEYKKAIQKLKEADKLFVQEGKGQTAEHATCVHILGRCYLTLAQDEKTVYTEGLTYTQQAAEMRKALFGEVSQEYVSSLNNTGLYYLTITKEYDKAREIISRSWSLCDKIRPRPESAFMFHMNLARCYMATEQWDKAEAIIKEELEVEAQTVGKESEEYGDFCKQIGSLYAYYDNMDYSVQYFEKAIKLCSPDSKGYESILSYVISYYEDKGNAEKANELYELIVRINEEELKKPCNDPECWASKGMYLATKGENNAARESFLQAIAMLDDSVSPDTVYKVRKFYAQFLSEIGDDLSAAENYEFAVEALAKYAYGNNEYALCCFSAGMEYGKVKSYDNAIRMLDLARKAYLGLNDKKMYIMLSNAICTDYRILRKSDDALRILDEAEYMLSETDSPLERAKLIQTRAAIFYFDKDYAGALPLYQKAAEVFKDDEGSVADYKDVMSKIGSCYVHLGNSDAAEQAWEASASSSERYENMMKSSYEKQLKDNLSQVENSRIMYGEEGLPHLSYLGRIGSIYFQLEDYANSLSYYERFLPKANKALCGAFRMSKAADRMTIWQQFARDYNEIPEIAVSTAVEGKTEQERFASLAYDALLFRKGVLLNSTIEFEALLHESGDKALLEMYSKAKQMADDIQTLQSEMSTATDKNAKLREIESKKNEYEKLQLELMRGSTEYGDYTRYLNVEWSDVAKKLKPGDVAIEFACIEDGVLSGEHHLAAFVITPDYKSPQTIMLLTQKELSDAMMGEYAFSTSVAGNRFWGLLDKYISKAERIYFSPDGILHKLPIEYLPYKNNTPLAFQKSVYRLSSTKELAIERKPIGYDNAVLFGGLDYELASAKTSKIVSKSRGMRGVGGFNELPFTLEEVNNIASTLKDAKIKTQAFTADRGTKAQFMMLNNSGTNLLHLATHGDYDSNIQEHDAESAMKRSVIAMSGANDSESSLLSAADISSMNLRGCRLTVLSACVSGQGITGADGLYGLQRGFKNAGVRALLMTLEEVDDEATMTLMTKFYEYLSSGSTERQALIKAQQDLITGDYSDAKYWSAFIMLDALE